MSIDLTSQTPPLLPPPASQVDARQVDQSLSQLQELARQLLRERDELQNTVQQLQTENAALKTTVDALKEKWTNYAPVIRQWGRSLITPEEVERIMKENKWITHEELMKEAQKVLDQP